MQSYNFSTTYQYNTKQKNSKNSAPHPAFFRGSGVVEVTKKDISWGCYFKVRGYDYDNQSHKDGKVFCTNDYIKPEDIQKILEQAPVEDVETSETSIRLEGKNLIADVSQPINLIVADLNGRSIFSGELKESAVIPLANVTSPFVVVRYICNERAYTKKFIIK